MLKFLATYTLILIALITNAQNADTFKVYGIVVSAFDKTPIPDATIMLSRTKGYRSDSAGQFIMYGLINGQHKLTFSAFGYPTTDTTFTIDNSDIKNFVWAINTTCNGNYNRQTALNDIKKGKANLLVQGGFAPIVYASDKDFKAKYGIGYDVFGCVAPDMDECLIIYNQTVAEYLDQAFGKKWRKDMRKDVIGLKGK